MPSKSMEFPTKNQAYEFFAEFNVTEESVKNDVQYLKEWIRTQPHLPNIEDEEWLTNFLLRCKNSLEKTKKRIDAYFTAKATMPEVFQGRKECLNQIREISQQCCLVPALKISPNGYRVAILRICENLENTTVNFEVIVKLAQMAMDFSLKVEFVRGHIIIIDLQNVNTSMILFAFSFLKKGITLFLNTTPFYIHKVYIVNNFPAAEPLIKLYKRFMKKKIADRIEIWTDDPKNLISVLPKELLPIEYGGNAGSSEELTNILIGESEKYWDWLISQEPYIADLSKRPADHLYNNAIFTDYGVDGSFRKICLD